jgi:RNA polymerase-binding transcription factor DksA
MITSQQVALVDVSHPSREAGARLRGLLTAESREQALRCAQHEALVTQLRGVTDVDSVLERELAEAGTARAREALSDIDHALERLDAGTYGFCESCGKPIPKARLQAFPAATLDVACKTRAERR